MNLAANPWSFYAVAITAVVLINLLRFQTSPLRGIEFIERREASSYFAPRGAWIETT